MSKQYNIRWRRSDYSKLSHLVRKVNKKVFEIEVKQPNIAEFQPAMLDYQELKKSVKTRSDLNKILHKYERYLKSGSEDVVKTERGGRLTKWAVNEIKIFDLTENAKRARTRKRLGEKEVTIGGQSTGVKRAEMGKIKENAVKPRIHNVKNMSQKDIENLFKLMDKKMHSSYDEEMQNRMKANYIKGLINAGYSDELIKIVEKVPLEKFVEIVDTDEQATFDFIYDPLELQAKTDALIGLWQKYIK